MKIYTLTIRDQETGLETSIDVEQRFFTRGDANEVQEDLMDMVFRLDTNGKEEN